MKKIAFQSGNLVEFSMPEEENVWGTLLATKLTLMSGFLRLAVHNVMLVSETASESISAIIIRVKIRHFNRHRQIVM